MARVVFAQMTDVDVLDNDDFDDDDDNKTLRSQNIPARGGFCPSRSFSAAFSFSSLLLRREAAQKWKTVKKCQKKVTLIYAQKYLDLRSKNGNSEKVSKKITLIYAHCDGVGKTKSMLDHNVVLGGHWVFLHCNFFQCWSGLWFLLS